MKSFVDKLNLKSSELRFLGFVALVVFAVLNIWLVWPHFYEWNTVQSDIVRTRKLLKEWQTKVERKPQLDARLRQLEKQGPTMLMAGQEGTLLSSIQTYERMNGVIDRASKATPKNPNAATNQFFEELGYQITISVDDDQLVNFLTDLASTNSMIRVREMKLDRDIATGGSRLVGTLKVVASYLKQPAAPPPAAVQPKPIAPSGGAAKPATNVVGKTNSVGRKS